MVPLPPHLQVSKDPAGLSFTRTWPGQGGVRTGGSGASSAHADRGPATRAQSTGRSWQPGSPSLALGPGEPL